MKIHLIALPHCEVVSAALDIVVSFAGCSGQRCMALSVLLYVGGEKQHKLLDMVMKNAAALKAGTDARCIGPVIHQNSSEKRRSNNFFLMEEDRWNHTKVKEGRADFYLPLVII